MSVLSLADVRYRYAGAAGWALDGIDLEIGAGDVIGICGPNDAGKSTLCLVAAGLAPGSIGGTLEGSVLLNGTDSRQLSPSGAAERCGILFQNAATQLTGTTATVWEEIAFGPRNLGLSVDAIAQAFKRVAKWIKMPAEEVAQVSGHSIRVGATQDLLALNIDLASVMQSGRWRSSRMPMRYGEHVLASRGGMARAAQAQGRDKEQTPDLI